jgi:hypothetical protein
VSITEFPRVGKFFMEGARIVEVGTPENEHTERFLNQIPH